MTAGRTGRRGFIRAHFDCRPGGCGAEAGQPCESYTWRRGSFGVPSPDVHAPRWRAFQAWARGERGFDNDQEAGNDETDRAAAGPAADTG